MATVAQSSTPETRLTVKVGPRSYLLCSFELTMAGFNNIGGGVYATQWTDQFIRIWFFPRNKGIPWDIQARQPNPSTWGTPMANFEGQSKTALLAHLRTR